MAGGVAPAIERVRQRLGHMVKVEVEVGQKVRGALSTLLRYES